jgi:hypothetical protein
LDEFGPHFVDFRSGAFCGAENAGRAVLLYFGLASPAVIASRATSLGEAVGERISKGQCFPPPSSSLLYGCQTQCCHDRYDTSASKLGQRRYYTYEDRDCWNSRGLPLFMVSTSKYACAANGAGTGGKPLSGRSMSSCPSSSHFATTGVRGGAIPYHILVTARDVCR